MRTLAALGVAAVVGLAGACRPDGSAPVAPPRAAGVAAVDSAAIRGRNAAWRDGGSLTPRGRGGPRFDIQKVTAYSDTINYAPTSVHCASNCNTGVPGTTSPIVVTLPKKATAITVFGNGPYKCSGVRPFVRAYDYRGTVVASGTMNIVDPPDCAAGGDDVSGELSLTLTSTTGLIAYLIVDPPSPWTITWTDPQNPANTFTGRALVDYRAVIVPSAVAAEPACNFGTDTLLAGSREVRTALVSALRRSEFANPDTSKRREYAGAIIRRADGSLVDRPFLPFEVDSVTQCTLKRRPEMSVMLLTGDSIVASYHTHPATPGENLPCAGEAIPYDPPAFMLMDAPDARDIALITGTRANNQLPAIQHYIIDGRFVYQTPGDRNPDALRALALGPVKWTIVRHDDCRFP